MMCSRTYNEHQLGRSIKWLCKSNFAWSCDI